jgi:hypothetical protein
MKRLSIRSFVLLLALFMIAGAWSPAHSVKAAKAAPKAFYTPYYFFYQPYDECIGYESTQEAEAWFLEYDGCLVDTNPSGTLIATGYMDCVWPHDLLPTVYLYMH